MLTSFTLISGIKKNSGCNACRGWERGLGGRQDLRKLSTNVASNSWWKERHGGVGGEGDCEESLLRKSQVARVSWATERIEAGGNKRIGRSGDEGPGEVWAGLEGFSVQQSMNQWGEIDEEREVGENKHTIVDSISSFSSLPVPPSHQGTLLHLPSHEPPPLLTAGTVALWATVPHSTAHTQSCSLRTVVPAVGRL